MKSKTYSELVRLPDFLDRFEYLKLNGSVGMETFGFDRYLNQALYHSDKWRRIRNEVILRDNGCDLAHPDRPIQGRIVIHHLNPITMEDIVNRAYAVFDLENLVSVSIDTHNAIHYGDSSLIFDEIVERSPNDTILWR